MIRCNSFCLAQDGAAASRASRRVDRIHRETVVMDGLGSNGRWSAVALALEGDRLPLIHGVCDAESSSLGEGPAGLMASRDAMGTRPLFVARSGKWIASDHRFFPGEAMELLRPGARIEVENWSVSMPRPERRVSNQTMEEAAETLANLIRGAVAPRVAGRKRVAIAFSGGLDSSVLAKCASTHAEVVACSFSAPGSVDEVVARKAAEVLDVEYAHAEADRGGVSAELKRMDLPFEPSGMDRALWCVYSKASRLASERGAEMIMLGQLADELFGGYAKYERALAEDGEERAARMMEEDVNQCGARGFLRDEMACSRWLEPSFPFADRGLAEFGLSLPMKLKISNGVRKAVLRKAAVILGLPEEMAMKQKKAAQYSSGVLKLLR